MPDGRKSAIGQASFVIWRSNDCPLPYFRDRVWSGVTHLLFNVTLAELFRVQCVAISAYVDDTVFDTADRAAEWRHL
jgi:hypothetical protein